ncbi:hypothetical protein JAAARDRAFT_59560 [Jaapia argillacea MUCL 33604]|uniref:Uncharacterized protein n=1 Tax=Jaapia argillacea MUCL 33604 TaxID=933084 RepID=A0A067PY23_9AGAM|nr:hypothetical protein JAAARDRAFT_59560 [Jaapia argillacea MUCL 33604]
MNATISRNRLSLNSSTRYSAQLPNQPNSRSAVSKTFNSIWTRVLYEDIVLQSLERIAWCCRTLSAKSNSGTPRKVDLHLSTPPAGYSPTITYSSQLSPQKPNYATYL